MKRFSALGKLIYIGLGILATLVVFAFTFTTLNPSLHNVAQSLLPIFLAVLGSWYIFGGVRRIGQSRKSHEDLSWYKQPRLVGGMASLLFGLCLLLSLLLNFLPGSTGSSVRNAVLAVLLILALLFFLISIILAIRKELESLREPPPG